MASVSIYLNFNGNAEEAFNHYKKVFQSEFAGPMMRMKDAPPRPGAPALPEAEKNKVMHVALPILGGTQIMATDIPDSMGHHLVEGNNFTISLNPDTKEEADRLYKGLSGGGKEDVAPHEEFRGYWGWHPLDVQRDETTIVAVSCHPKVIFLAGQAGAL